jgi:hypothetical protein
MALHVIVALGRIGPGPQRPLPGDLKRRRTGPRVHRRRSRYWYHPIRSVVSSYPYDLATERACYGEASSPILCLPIIFWHLGLC